ncbi:MAG: class I SAM-dependent methyltransferase [Candidatus Diapherotrites archaeon]|nr:class I SAM-dependent methyltransferase [Candidatus Micrarchaeota archaeon]MBU1940081.1 class I SAM-dependent methyltransferase [Candidatus Micrarchaeota archaeon]
MGALDFLRMNEAKNIKDLDAPEATAVHARILMKKKFLRNIYRKFYHEFDRVSNSGLVVELGSGGGFIKEVHPDFLTSDIMALPNTDLTFSALDMPFEKNTVSALVMVDALHHFVDADKFFHEANRVLKKGGKIIMVEPAQTLLGLFIYMFIHHEKTSSYHTWKLLDDKGEVVKDGLKPLSCSNPSAPTSIFFTEREFFEKQFPKLRIKSIRLHTPFAYILSGGLSMKQLAPDFTYGFVSFFEWLASPLNKYLAMFMTVELEKK